MEPIGYVLNPSDRKVRIMCEYYDPTLSGVALIVALVAFLYALLR